MVLGKQCSKGWSDGRSLTVGAVFFLFYLCDPIHNIYIHIYIYMYITHMIYIYIVYIYNIYIYNFKYNRYLCIICTLIAYIHTYPFIISLFWSQQGHFCKSSTCCLSKKNYPKSNHLQENIPSKPSFGTVNKHHSKRVAPRFYTPFTWAM